MTEGEWAIRKAATKAKRDQKRAESFQGRNRKITGERFGLLLVLQYDGQDKWLNSRWICLCKCGNLHTATKHNLTSGVIKSCGCRGIVPFVCTKCGEKKDAGDFVKEPRKVGGIGTRCKKCASDRTCRWAKGNREHLAKLSRKRYATNPDVREKSHARSKLAKYKRKATLKTAVANFTAEQWRLIKAAYNHRCAYCGERKPLTQDHVLPISKGGHHTASNIVPACRSCNSSKGARLPVAGYQPHLIA